MKITFYINEWTVVIVSTILIVLVAVINCERMEEGDELTKLKQGVFVNFCLLIITLIALKYVS